MVVAASGISPLGWAIEASPAKKKRSLMHTLEAISLTQCL